jgi:hypothetical protein
MFTAPHPLRSPPRLTRFGRRGGEIDAPTGEDALDRYGIALGGGPYPPAPGVTILTVASARKRPTPLTSGSTSLPNRRRRVRRDDRGETPGHGQQPRAIKPQLTFRLGAVYPTQSHATARPAGAAARAVHPADQPAPSSQHAGEQPAYLAASAFPYGLGH